MNGSYTDRRLISLSLTKGVNAAKLGADRGRKGDE